MDCCRGRRRVSFTRGNRHTLAPVRSAVGASQTRRPAALAGGGMSVVLLCGRVGCVCRRHVRWAAVTSDRRHPSAALLQSRARSQPLLSCLSASALHLAAGGECGQCTLSPCLNLKSTSTLNPNLNPCSAGRAPSIAINPHRQPGPVLQIRTGFHRARSRERRAPDRRDSDKRRTQRRTGAASRRFELESAANRTGAASSERAGAPHGSVAASCYRGSRGQPRRNAAGRR